MTSRPNVVLIVLDTVRADGPGLGLSTATHMPALAEFAASGTVFPDTYATSPWTLPSHASLFTGAWVWRHGCDELHRHLDGRLPTLAEQLAAAGYATGAASANAWVGPDFGLDRGFERFLRSWRLMDRADDLSGVRRAGRIEGHTDLHEAMRRARSGGYIPAVVNVLHHLIRRRTGHLGGERVARQAVRLAHELKADGRPVFLFVNFLDAHLRYWPPRRYRRATLGPDVSQARRVNQNPWAFIGGRARMTDLDFAILRKLYWAELGHLDDLLGLLLAGIDRELGLDNTLVVVTSDHGEHLGEHGLMDHQYSLSEILLKVPLLLRGPGQPTTGVVGGLRQTVDIAPTLLAAAGCAPHEGAGLGMSLTEQPRDWAVAEYLAPQPTMAALARRGDPASFRRYDRGLRAMWTAERRKVVVGTDDSIALHDLVADPDELTDLSTSRTEQAVQLSEQLAELCTPDGDHGSPAPEHEESPPDAAMRRALEGLGYLQ